MKFDTASNQKLDRSIIIDIPMINVHTGWYVIVRGLPTQRVLDLS
jgi:hypothetical protein